MFTLEYLSPQELPTSQQTCTLAEAQLTEQGDKRGLHRPAASSLFNSNDSSSCWCKIMQRPHHRVQWSAVEAVGPGQCALLDVYRSKV